MDTAPEAAPLQAAIQKLGSQAALAAQCGVSPQAVTDWIRRGKPPASRVLAIEAATGISRHQLRPDVFGAAQ